MRTDRVSGRFGGGGGWKCVHPHLHTTHGGHTQPPVQMHSGIHPPPRGQNDWHTSVKTLPSLCGNKQSVTRENLHTDQMALVVA